MWKQPLPQKTKTSRWHLWRLWYNHHHTQHESDSLYRPISPLPYLKSWTLPRLLSFNEYMEKENSADLKIYNIQNRPWRQVSIFSPHSSSSLGRLMACFTQVQTILLAWVALQWWSLEESGKHLWSFKRWLHSPRLTATQNGRASLRQQRESLAFAAAACSPGPTERALACVLNYRRLNGWFETSVSLKWKRRHAGSNRGSHIWHGSGWMLIRAHSKAAS